VLGGGVGGGGVGGGKGGAAGATRKRKEITTKQAGKFLCFPARKKKDRVRFTAAGAVHLSRVFPAENGGDPPHKGIRANIAPSCMRPSGGKKDEVLTACGLPRNFRRNSAKVFGHRRSWKGN